MAPTSGSSQDTTQPPKEKASKTEKANLDCDDNNDVVTSFYLPSGNHENTCGTLSVANDRDKKKLEPNAKTLKSVKVNIMFSDEKGERKKK
jgi:hypothetical protein